MTRFCPLCNASEFNIIKQIEHESVNYIIGKCKQCSFVYVTNPNTNTIRDRQTLDSTRTSIPAPKQRHLQIKRLIDSYYQDKQKIKVFEVGSGYGSLAKILSSDSQYFYCGFEPSEIRAKFCQNYNLNVKNCFFGSKTVDFIADSIVIDNVLEHVLKPRKLIEASVKVLSKKGILIVIVPNFHDIRQLKLSWRKRHLWQPSCHINYFTSYHLQKLFRENNISFYPFGLSSLDLGQDWLFVPKVFLDSINIYKLGLYCYGIKQ